MDRKYLRKSVGKTARDVFLYNLIMIAVAVRSSAPSQIGVQVAPPSVEASNVKAMRPANKAERPKA